MLRRWSLALLIASICRGQVYSPVVLKARQVDSTSVESLARGIYSQSGAVTPREKAEAIWRFFLTDGRFVKPGFWYHIAGWAYEEPKGEVLDPVKLLNSYGFGLCYHIAPLLEAVFEAGGFQDARVWFLTGHTVAEVFYDGSYHYFDSDMLGYNAVGSGPLKQRRVASVHDIEKDGRIILDKLAADEPWYPADVRANAIPGLAELFTTTEDNWVFPFTRYASGHSMDFTLRPGERVTRYFHPQDDRLYYLPFTNDGKTWREFPQESDHYNIRTRNGPQSQKDGRRWGTGTIEYRPPMTNANEFVIDMPCPWVIIDAAFTMNAELPANGRVAVETSADGGRTWKQAAALAGPHAGPWRVEPAIVAQTPNGKRTEVSGTYGYQVRVRRSGAHITDLLLTTRFQVNPRTLPELTAGKNELRFRSANKLRTEIPIRPDLLDGFTSKVVNAEYTAVRGQGWVRNVGNETGLVIFEVKSPDASPISSFDAGGRFLDLRDGLAPDKLTAEVRKVTPWPAGNQYQPSASLAWSLKPDGPWTTLWSFDPKLVWKDGEVIDRTLRWPEVQRTVGHLPDNTRRAYVRYQFNGIAIDDFRLAYGRSGLQAASPVKVIHIWKENGAERRFAQEIGRGETSKDYVIDIPERTRVDNRAIVFENN